MSESPGPVRLTLRRLRPITWIALCAIAYGVITFSFGLLTEHEGLLLPMGPPRLWVLLLGAIAIALRLALLFVAPAFVAYRLALCMMRRAPRRADGRRRAEHEPRAGGKRVGLGGEPRR